MGTTMMAYVYPPSLSLPPQNTHVGTHTHAYPRTYSLQHIQPLNHMAKHNMLAIALGGGGKRNVELRRVAVLPAAVKKGSTAGILRRVASMYACRGL
jgi:hypothetical protein